jgi:competence protein ComEA
MDPNATPWRVLEDPTDRTSPSAPVAATRSVPRSALVVASATVVLSVIAFVLAFGAGASGTVVIDGGMPLGSDAPAAGDTIGIGIGPSAGSDPPLLVVEIVGAVVQPGVFRLPPDARVGDLVEAAGGYGTRVDAARASRELNLAAPLHDGDQVRVPSRDDDPATGPQPAATAATSTGDSDSSGPLDLNRATSAELEALPGIGPVTAGKILSSREEQPFASVDELRTRKLLGVKTFDKLKDLVTVR